MVIAPTRNLMQTVIFGPRLVIVYGTRSGWKNIARKAAAAKVLYKMKIVEYLAVKCFASSMIVQ